MKKILVTGSNGFIGKNLVTAFLEQKVFTVTTYEVADPPAKLKEHLQAAEVVFHLAGVNRPQHPDEYATVNIGLTKTIVELLIEVKHYPVIVFSSSVQAQLNNPYGISKLKAEEELQNYAQRTGAVVYLFRLPGVFGKWCRPNYNSVVATFCYNIAHNLDITISEPTHEIELVYIDDVIKAFLKTVEDDRCGTERVIRSQVVPTFRITLGALAEKIREFKASRDNLMLHDFSDRFTKYLYATYLTYLDNTDFAYELVPKLDERGMLVELLKSKHLGQIFVSRTKPGITRGNHYHHTKAEKFCVIEGEAILRFRHILGKEVFTYHLSGKNPQVVDIPPGYTHSIENVGQSEMIVLFWASEPFDPTAADTYHAEVLID